MSVTYEVRTGVALIALDDGKVNALSPQVLEALHARVDEAENDDEVKALVVTGRPGYFSAGFDLRVFRESPQQTMSMVSAGGRLAQRLYALPKPVVGAASGHAIAMGSLILLGCDTRIGSRGAFKIGLNEVQAGMVLPDWAMALAEARLNARDLQRATVNAHMFDPESAVPAGFLDATAEPDILVDQAVAEAGRLATLHAQSYASMVEIARTATVERMSKTLQPPG